jgi:D-alanyl-D-alanine carboxypeptidase
MLLSHTSGIPDHVFDPDFIAAVRRQITKSPPDFDFSFSPVELVQFILDDDALFPAGRGYHYSDTGYILLGMIIERVTNDTYYRVLTKRILDPLGLTATLPADRRDLPELVPGYVAQGDAMGLPNKTTDAAGLLIFSPSAEWTGGGILSTSMDLVRWARALFEGKVMGWPYLNVLVDSTVRTETGSRYALGVSISNTSLGAVWGHDGRFPGYRTKIGYFPETRAAIAVQVNTDSADLGGIFAELAETVNAKIKRR